jgi:hypothetical protein
MRSFVFGCLGWGALLAASIGAEPHRPWSGGITYTFAHDGPSIVLGELRQDEQHLTGIFLFENISGPRQHAKDVMLDGVETSDGHFWPRVRCEVRRRANSPQDPWESIGIASIAGKQTKLRVKAESPVVRLWVRLDIFQPLIGKYLAARIVLNCGEPGDFSMSDIAPPPTVRP